MRVLWISNVIFPDACKHLGIEAPYGGGWMYSCAKALLKESGEIQLGVISFYKASNLLSFKEKNIQYYLIPLKDDKKYDKSIENYYIKIKQEFQPDIIHIHGSEYPHSLAYIKACGNQNVIVSIQGMVSIYSQYYLGNINYKCIKKYRTLRDLIRKDSLLDQQKEMRKRGEYEKTLISNIKYVIGRTTWDYSCSWAINPTLRYFKCNETLRSTFYKREWHYDTCEPFRIFLSQAHYPIKGLQQVIQALPMVLRKFPKTKVYIAGNNFISKSRLRRNGFANYIKHLMQKNQVTDKFIFLGNLSEEEMAEQFIKANVFICPSAIENSPNSIGEAQLIGTPTVASYVGGTMDMITDNIDGYLYRYEEINLLSLRICNIFEEKELATRISIKARETAHKRHNPQTNVNKLLSIYHEILNLEKQ